MLTKLGSYNKQVRTFIAASKLLGITAILPYLKTKETYHMVVVRICQVLSSSYAHAHNLMLINAPADN